MGHMLTISGALFISYKKRVNAFLEGNKYILNPLFHQFCTILQDMYKQRNTHKRITPGDVIRILSNNPDKTYQIIINLKNGETQNSLAQRMFVREEPFTNTMDIN